MALGLGVTGVLAVVGAIAIVTPSGLGPQLESQSGIADLRSTPAISLEPGADPSGTVGAASTGGEPFVGSRVASPDPGPGDADPVTDSATGTAGDPSDPITDPPATTPATGTRQTPIDTTDTASSGTASSGTAPGSSRPPAPSNPITTPIAIPLATPLATPLAAGGLGVVASSVVSQLMSIGEQIGNHLGSPEWNLPFEIDVRLADGRIGRAEVIDPGDRNVPALIRLPAEMATDGYPPAISEPQPGDLVTVLADTPIVMRYVELVDLDPSRVLRGTAIIDQWGHLLGLCEHGGTDTSIPMRILMVSEIDWSVSETTRAD